MQSNIPRYYGSEGFLFQKLLLRKVTDPNDHVFLRTFTIFRQVLFWIDWYPERYFSFKGYYQGVQPI